MHRALSTVFFLLLSAGASGAVPVGTIALYSDGKVEKLIAKEERGLRWEDDRKRQFLRSRNPAIPVLESRHLISGNFYFQEVHSGNPDSIRGLPPGTSVEFTMIRHRNGGVRMRHWECAYLGSARGEVLGQMRSLDRYRCERFAIHKKLHNRSFREQREFSYSPELGVTVDLERKTRKRTRTRRLVALFPPGEADYKTLSRAVRKIRTD
jgi:hypothetical protein